MFLTSLILLANVDTSMKKATLLEKVQTIEQEADDIVGKARTTGERTVQDIRAREQEIVEDIQAEAKERGQKIVKERVTSMKDTIGKIKDESGQAAGMVKKAADKNRADVLKKAQQLFTEQYLN